MSSGRMLRCHLFLSIFMVFIAMWRASLENIPAILTAIDSLLTATVPSSLLERYSTKEVPPDVAKDILSLFIAREVKTVIQYMPVYAIILLGIYALSSVIYKVVTFEDCNDAAVELSEEIEGAKKKLKEKGFTF